MAIDATALRMGRILDLDPELGSGLGAGEWEKARRACRGAVASVGCGAWKLPPVFAQEAARIGVVILDGMVCREVAVGERHMCELLGPGDLIALPATAERRELGEGVRLTVVADTVVVGLGESFTRSALRWPCLLEAVVGRLEAQRERLALQGVITHFSRAEDRVLLALWLLAQRWGRPTPDGIVLSLALTHDLLGELTASRRSTVTVAVATLESAGSITRLDDGSWLLGDQAEHDVRAITSPSSPPEGVGERFLRRQLTLHAQEQARALRAEAIQARARSNSARAAARSARRPTHPGERPDT